MSGGRAELETVDAVSLAEGTLFVVAADDDPTDLKAWTVTGIRRDGEKTFLDVEAEDPLAAVESYRLEYNDAVSGPREPSRGTRSRSSSEIPENKDEQTSVTYTVGTHETTVTVSTKTRVNGYYDYKFSRKREGYFEVVTTITTTTEVKDGTSLKDMIGGVNDLVTALQDNPIEKTSDLLSSGCFDVPDYSKIGKIGVKTSVNLSAAMIGRMEHTVTKTRIIRIDGENVSTVREDVQYDKSPRMEMIGKLTLSIKSSYGFDLLLGSSLNYSNNSSIVLSVNEAPQYDEQIRCYDTKVTYKSGASVNARLGVSLPENKVLGKIEFSFLDVSVPVGPELSMDMDMFKKHIEYRAEPEEGQPSMEVRSWCSVRPKDQYVIHFHSGTGTTIRDVYSKAGNTVPVPDSEPKAQTDRIRFQYWSTEPINGEPFDFEAPLPEIDEEQAQMQQGPNVLDLWAVWSEPYQLLTIDLNYADVEPTQQYVLPGENVDPPSVPYRMEQHFEKWIATSVSDTTVVEQEWDFYRDVMPAHDLNVRAIWVYEAGYDPIAADEQALTGDEALYQRMIGDLEVRSFISTEMQGMGAYSRNDNWRVLNYGLAGVTGYTGDSPLVVIPERINGSPVVFLDGSGWENKDSLKALVVPSTVSYIKGFSSFKNLQYVVFRDGLVTFTGAGNVELRFEGTETIAAKCFKDCPSLTSLSFPRYLHSIGDEAFNATGLLELNLGMIPCASLGKKAFMDCTNLTTVVLPNGIDWLKDQVFCYCHSLKHINLEHIRYFSFGCLASTGLEELTLSNVQSLDGEILTWCRYLTSLTIQFSPESEGTNTTSLGNLESLEEIVLEGCTADITNAPKLHTCSISNIRGDIKGPNSIVIRNLPSLSTLNIHNCIFDRINVENCEVLEDLSLEGTRLSNSYAGSFDYSFPPRLKLDNTPRLTSLDLSDISECWIELVIFNTGIRSLDLSSSRLKRLWAEDQPALKTLRLSELPESVAVMPDITIMNTGLEELALPTGQGSISLVLENNAELRRLLYPDTLVSFQGRIHGNPALTYVRLPVNNSVVFPGECFRGCSALRELTIPACWTAEQLHGTLLKNSSVACLKVNGSADVSGLSATGELFVVETAVGSSAWNALEGKGFLLRQPGSGKRAVRFKYLYKNENSYQTSVLTPQIFEHPDKVAGQIIETVPGRDFHMPAVTLQNNRRILTMQAGGTEIQDPMTAPDADFTINVTCGAVPSAEYEVAEGGIRLTSLTGAENGTSLFIPDAVDNYPVVEVAPAVYSAGDYTDIYLPGTLLRISGEDFADCTALCALHGEGTNWKTEEGMLYGTDSAETPVSLLLCPQKLEGILTLPDTVTELGSYSVLNAAGLTGLTADSLTVIREHAVTGDNAVTELNFPATLEEIQDDNFRRGALETVTFAGDTDVADAAFGSGSVIRFFGPVSAQRLTAWADRNGEQYNLYTVTFSDGENEVSLELRAGSSLSDWNLSDTKESIFLGWSEDASAQNPALVAVMPARDVRLEPVRRKLFTIDGTILTGVDPQAGTDIRIPWGVETIASGAVPFAVETIRIPATVTSIHNSAFSAVGKIIGDEGTESQAFAARNNIPFETAVYTITFESNGGTAAETLNSSYNEALVLPEPTRTYARFTGWHTDFALTERFTAETMPGYDLTLYAGWDFPGGFGAGFTTGYLENGTLTITRYDGSSTCPVIPSEINGVAVTAIADYAFAGNQNVMFLTLPAGITSIGEHAFDSATALTGFEMKAEQAEIGRYALANCSALRIVKLPSGQTSLPAGLFAGCDSLITVDLPDTLKEIGDGAFADCGDLYTLTLPAGLQAFSRNTVRNSPLRSIHVAPENTALAGDGTAVWTADETMLLYVCPTAKELSMPETVTVIGEYAASGCRNLTAAILPDTLQTISEGAFSETGIRELNLPASLAVIGSRAFENCFGLDTVYIPDTVTEIGERIFGSENVLIYVDSETGAPFLALNGTYHVLVSDTHIPPASLAFAEEEITVLQGETLTLLPVFSPEGTEDDRLTWYLGESQWGDVVSLTQDGQITGLESGTQTVYAETPSGLRAQITVNVSDESVNQDKVTDVVFSTYEMQNSFYGFRNGIAVLEADGSGEITAKPMNNRVDRSWFDISCPEYPGLFEAGNGYTSFYTNSLPEGVDVVDATMVITGTGDRSLGFRKEIPCKVFRKAYRITSTLRLPESQTLFVGDRLFVEGYREGMFELPFSREMGYCFTSSNPAVADVDETGHIRALSPGTATIRIAGASRNGTCVVLVQENLVNLTASLSSERILQGKTETLTASVRDSTVTLVYSSDDESIAAVNSNGRVSFRSRGTTILHVRAVRNGRVLAGRNWRVQTLVPYTSWNLENLSTVPGYGKALKLDIGSEYESLSSCVKSEYSYPDTETVHWTSSDESVVSINDNGTANIRKIGTAILTGTLDFDGSTVQLTACCDYWNGYGYLEWVFSESRFTLAVGESKPLEFIFIGNRKFTPVFTTSDSYGYSGRVNVDEAGIVTGVAPGSATINVSLQNSFGLSVGSASLYVYVLENGECGSIAGLPEEIELFAGETVTLAGTDMLRPAGSAFGEDDRIIISDETVACFDTGSGALTVTGIKPGTATLRIELEHGETYDVTLRVNKPDVYCEIQSPPAVILRGESTQLQAAEIHTAGSASIAWASSDSTVLTIDADGTASGIKTGEAEILMTVTDGETGGTYTARAEIRVCAALSGFSCGSYEIATRDHSWNYFLELAPASSADDLQELAERTTVESLQGYAYTVHYDDPYQWDSDDSRMLYLYTEEYPDLYDRVTLVTDNGTSVLRKTFDLGFDTGSAIRLKDSVRIAVGQTLDLMETINSYYGCRLKPSWTVSNTSVARISNGTVTGLAEGSVTLTATTESPDGTVRTAETTLTVTVSPTVNALTRENGDTGPLNLEVGENIYSYSITVSPASAAVWCETADSRIARVTLETYYDDYYDEDEQESASYAYLTIKGLQAGRTTVTIRGVEGAQLVIPVEVVPAFSFTTNLINQSRMFVGAAKRIRVTCTPADPDAVITYASNSDSFTVDADGLLTAVKAGSARITVTVNGKESVYVLYADTPYNIASVSPGSARLISGATASFRALDTNGNAIPNYYLTWSSSDPVVLQVDSSGTATAGMGGTATVTVRTRSGLSSATVSVRVKNGILSSLQLPNDLTAVEAEAFTGLTGIETVKVGSKVTSIGPRAFAGCSKLNEVIILSNYCEVDPTAFTDCSDELVVYCAPDSDTWNSCVEAGIPTGQP